MGAPTKARHFFLGVGREGGHVIILLSSLQSSFPNLGSANMGKFHIHLVSSLETGHHQVAMVSGTLQCAGVEEEEEEEEEEEDGGRRTENGGNRPGRRTRFFSAPSDG